MIAMPQPVQDVAAALEQAICRAVDWQSLKAALAHVQRAIEAGQVTHEQADRLTVLAAQEAGCLPDEAELLPGAEP